MNRVFFITDVHASDRCFRKFLNAAKFYNAQTLILGGDITGKVLVPIVERPDGRYSLPFLGRETLISREQLEEHRKKLLDAGQYCFLTTPKELEELNADKTRQERVFEECMLSEIRSWYALAEERLRGTQVKCYISPGNDDKFEVDSELQDRGQIINPEGKVVELNEGYEMITLGYANPTPWKSPREVPEEKLGEMIESMAERVRRQATAIYNLHVPPHGTELDRAPAVSSDFNYVKDGLGVKMIHAGSTAVRASIEKHQPMLGLHGHIHESKGIVKLGKTLCMNPGSEYGDGILRGALVVLDGDRVKEFQLTSG